MPQLMTTIAFRFSMILEAAFDRIELRLARRHQPKTATEFLPVLRIDDMEA